MREANHHLTVSYKIKPFGPYEHDLLARQLAGPTANEVSFGTVNFASRLIEYAFSSADEREAARGRFASAGPFRLLG